MIVLGVDPGFERLGVAIIEKKVGLKKEKVLFSECFKTPSTLPFSQRLGLIGKEIKKVIKDHKPTILAIETLFLNTNQKTAMRVAEARGVVIYEANNAGLEIFEATPPEIKTAVTGWGRSDKNQMIKMVKMLVDVDKNKHSDDEMDAIAIALTACAKIR